MTTQQPEVLRLAANLESNRCHQAARELRSQHARIVELEAKLAASTNTTKQGMADLRWQIVHDHISGEYIAGRACFVVQIPALPGANIMRGSVAEHFTKAVDAIAAQAKQGGK